MLKEIKYCLEKCSLFLLRSESNLTQTIGRRVFRASSGTTMKNEVDLAGKLVTCKRPVESALKATCSLKWVQHPTSILFFSLSFFSFSLQFSAASETDTFWPGPWTVIATSSPVGFHQQWCYRANKHPFLYAGFCTLPRTVLNRRLFL